MLCSYFDIFDVDDNGRIEFAEFVQILSVFHPKTPDAVKSTYAFKLYDLRRTGYIEHEELKVMVLALLDESDLVLSDDIVEMIVDKTFKDADGKADGRIDEEEWKEYVAQNPSLLKNMTLPYLNVILVISWTTSMCLICRFIGVLVFVEVLVLLGFLTTSVCLRTLCRDITLAFPSFVLNNKAERSKP
ncbi:hypothetical protein ACFX11_000883 [Malus domestica]